MGIVLIRGMLEGWMSIVGMNLSRPGIKHHHPLQWRHHEHGGVSNHQPHDCLLNRLFRHRSKKTSKLRVTVLCKKPVTRKRFPFDDVFMSRYISNNVYSCVTREHIFQALFVLSGIIQEMHCRLLWIHRQATSFKTHLLYPQVHEKRTFERIIHFWRMNE